MKKDVSVIVITYNHEKYIYKALESIENQDFDGTIEIILHDDASTDKTREIYEDYSKKTKHSIKIIRQTENRYSKKINCNADYISVCNGNFIAFCDGDDYWIDKSKIYNQITALNIRQDIDICFHSAIIIDYEFEKIIGVQGDFGENPLIIPASNIIERWHSPIPSASALIRKSVIEQLPSWFFDSPIPPIGDYFFHVFGALKGGAIYLPMAASVYRRGDPSSWTNRTIASKKSMNDWEISLMQYIPLMKESLPVILIPSIEQYAVRTFKGFLNRNIDDADEILRMIRSMKNI